jgi:hypothetical protein
MKYISMFPWMIIDMALFVAVNALLIHAINPNFGSIVASLSFVHFLILGLAVYRGANIVSNEFITLPLRAYFVREVERDGKHVEEPYDQGLRGFIGSLLYCPSCTGVWIAMIMTYSYIVWPGPASLVILLVALSGLERFFAYTFGRIKNK